MFLWKHNPSVFIKTLKNSVFYVKDVFFYQNTWVVTFFKKLLLKDIQPLGLIHLTFFLKWKSYIYVVGKGSFPGYPPLQPLIFSKIKVFDKNVTTLFYQTLKHSKNPSGSIKYIYHFVKVIQSSKKEIGHLSLFNIWLFQLNVFTIIAQPLEIEHYRYKSIFPISSSIKNTISKCFKYISGVALEKIYS